MPNVQCVPTEAIVECLAKLFKDILDGDDVVIGDELAAYMSATGQELLQKLLAIRWECDGVQEAQSE